MAEGGVLRLSWRAGPLPVFFDAMAAAPGPAEFSPARFDWLRLRDLLESSDVGAEVRRDPWTVDWRAAAARSRLAGFDARRLKPASLRSVPFKVPAAGPWFEASPFADPLPWSEGDTATLPLAGRSAFAVCPSGALEASSEGSAWFPR